MAEADPSDVTHIISRALKEAEEKGFQRGFEAGREEERRVMRRFIAANRGDLIEMESQLQVLREAVLKLAADFRNKLAHGPHPPVVKKPRDQDIVLDVIRRTSGLTGQQLVERCEQEKTPVRERSLRTSLYRLKKAGDIYKQGEGWHARDPRSPTLPLHGEAPSENT
jgi:hypothetical protein